MPRVSTKSFSYPQDAFENFKDAFASREPTAYGDMAFVEQLRDLLRQFPDRWTDADIVAMLKEMHSSAEAAQLQALLNKAKQLDPQASSTRRPTTPTGGKTKPKSDIPVIKADSVVKAPVDKPKDGDENGERSDRATQTSVGRAGPETQPETDDRKPDVADPQDEAQHVIAYEHRQPPAHRGIEN